MFISPSPPPVTIKLVTFYMKIIHIGSCYTVRKKMAFYFSKGFIKVVQKILLIVIAAYIYSVLSLIMPPCPKNEIGWKIYPFEHDFFASSILFMASAAIKVAESDVWPCNTRPRNKLIRFVGEVWKLFF